MAHRSRIGVVVIDCQTEDLAPATRFWSAMLGMTGEVDADGRYAVFDGHAGHPKVLLQAVDHAPRVHLDVETDDREAECARLAALGAVEVARVKNWIVMQAPTGHRFCLVGPQGDDFPGNAKQWDS
ncbi:VOC family protein [Aquibium sp. A9E412]|uniref:VOC family protein n=1 Tax=Aquibium sp. A9E412 TaxID=2976767 RepID=UPI0025B038D4|nr:VOC family protein [Aquibium sp. A9E412]MDN2565129.1 VOC family protein [Aquibium sp. A9E412]